MAKAASIPAIAGKPVFVPSRFATAMVGAALVSCAVLVATVSHLIFASFPHAVVIWLSYALAAGLLFRAIGDFRLVGFFKRIKDSRFAQLDTWVYSPLCLLLALGVFLVADGYVD